MTTVTRNNELFHETIDTVLMDGIKGNVSFSLTSSHDPEEAATRFGIPVAVLMILDGVFSELTENEGLDFLTEISEFIDCDDKDLSRVQYKFIASEIKSLPPHNDTVTRDALDALDAVVEGLEMLSDGAEWVGKEHTLEFISLHPELFQETMIGKVIRFAAESVDDPLKASEIPINAVRAENINLSVREATLRQRDTILSLLAEAPMVEEFE